MSELTHSKIFPLVHHTSDRSWFSLADLLKRSTCQVGLFYYLYLTNPLKMTNFAFKYNTLWYGNFVGTALTLALPVEPVAYGVVESLKMIRDKLFAVETFDSHSIFFVAPEGPLNKWLWEWQKNFSVFVSGFMICRNQDGSVSGDAVGHTWYDSLMDKYFWRGLLEKTGARVPRELARWHGGKLEKFYPEAIASDVVFKLPDSYLGLGDLFWDHGKDFKAEEDLVTKLKTEDYADKEVLLLDLIRPSTDKSFKAISCVHQLDILTINSVDEGVKCFNVVYWGGCTDNSSHSCTEGYLVDVETETITGSTVWYSAYFQSQPKTMIGEKVPGVKKAVADAIRAHKEHPHGWCRVVGWDAIITDNGPVFFEGNIAAHRTPRRVFLDWPNPSAFLNAFGL